MCLIGQDLSVSYGYASNLSREHMTALERAFSYLRGTIDYYLTYTRYSDAIEGCYSDANWVTDSYSVVYYKICIHV